MELVNIILYSITLFFSTIQICIATHFLTFMIMHQSKIKKRQHIDCLFVANIYIILLCISCFLLDMCIYYIYGFTHPNISFNNRWCQIKAYFMYICGYTFFHSFSFQAIYRICRIIYPIQTKNQPFRFYIIVSFGQWVLSALELLPSLLIGDMEYLNNDYHCQISPSSMRGSLTVCVLGFLFSFIMIACSYVYTIYYVRQHNLTIITVKQRKSMRRDMVILKRVLIILTLLTSSAAPHAAFPVVYRFLGSLPLWLVALEWLLTILALISIALTLPLISPHLKQLYTVTQRYDISISVS